MLTPCPATCKAQVDAAGMIVESLAGIRPKPVAYLVPDRIPAGMMGLIAGEGGHGKSVTGLNLVTAVTSGRCAFGLHYPNPVRGKALLVTCEDDWERTIVPRLAALGADLNRTLRVRGVRMKAGGELLDFHLGHFQQLEQLLTNDPEIKLVVIDPAGAYIGRSGVNENKDADLRTILGPLSEAANKSGATILLIKHLNKSAGVSAVQRVSGSVGYINAVRFAYMVTPDPDDHERKLFLPIKLNVLKSGLAGLTYRLESIPPDEARALLLHLWPDLDPGDTAKLSEQLLRQKWEGETEITADSVMGVRRTTKCKMTADDCETFIRDCLGKYAHPEKEVKAAVLKAGFSLALFKTVKTNMRTPNLNDTQRLSDKPKGAGGAWWMWIGPQGSRPDDRPEASSVVHLRSPQPLYQTDQTHQTDHTSALCSLLNPPDQCGESGESGESGQCVSLLDRLPSEE
jgi:hypothetical protein